ncbi:hypothetical protein [Gloeocapsopsis dulcis]|uniref:Uncharacterized protein n=1 Tax=Gloeocapsopsis dulcis AAB1 = 1H9 TaxID=1433147 RepID=A0A6N8G1N1_9CHRO|nr:hypothetical protein [Gloeocapsopsis dulcis]MUL39310.1 hypothetical protein [Gloeocapsopsis dulcis AAB1 = 1H9]WNN91556.1 hypothetical protein P0S91_10980 [Gloeocapsopsis dulcis]
MSECSDIYAAIARLEKKIDSIPRVNEQAIIQQSVALSKSALLPEFAKYTPLFAFGAVQTKVNGLGNSLDTLRSATNQLGEKVNVATKVANQAKVATDNLGRTVLDHGKKLGNLGSKVVNLDQKLGGLLSKLQQLGGQLGSLLNRLLPILNIIGSLAGLAALYSQLKIVFPRLDAHDRELDAHRQALSDNLSAAHRGINMARAAQRTADEGVRKANQALYELVGARASAYAAQRTANDGVTKANQADRNANAAQRTADQGVQLAKDASTAIPPVRSAAQQAQRTADQGVQLAKDTSTAIPPVRSAAQQAQRTADQALQATNAANTTAKTADTKATQALNQAKTGVTTTPSTGITKSEAELTRYINTTVRQATGITAEQAKAEQIRQQQIIPQIVNNTIQKSPVIQQIQSTVNTPVTPQQINSAVQQSPTIQQIQNTVKVQEQVNTASNQKLDTIDQKINNLTNINNQQTTLLGTIQDIIKGIQNLINSFVNQINNLINQLSITINKINDLINKLNTFIQSVNNQLRSILNYLIAALAILTFVQPLIPIILANTIKIINGISSISTFLKRFAKSIHLDKILNALTLVVVLHNAAMLSSNLAATLGELASQSLSALGIKDEEGNQLDINQILSTQVNSFFESLLGKAVWGNTVNAWQSANTIVRTTANIYNTIQSLGYAARNLGEFTASIVGKIGNALRRDGVVDGSAYEEFPEEVNSATLTQKRLERFINKLENIDDAASAISSVTSDAATISESISGLRTQVIDFQKSVDDGVNQTKSLEAVIRKDSTIPDHTEKDEVAA